MGSIVVTSRRDSSCAGVWQIRAIMTSQLSSDCSDILSWSEVHAIRDQIACSSADSHCLNLNQAQALEICFRRFL